MNPQGTPLNIVISPEVDEKLPVTLKLKQVSVSEAFLCVMEQASLDYRMDSRACVIVDSGLGQLAVRPQRTSAEMGQLKPVKLAQQTVFPQIEYDEAPLRLVLNHLASYHNDSPDQDAPMNLVATRWIDTDLPVSLKMKNVSIATVLGKIAEQTAIEIRGEPYAIILDPPGTALYRQAQMEATRIGRGVASVRRHHDRRGSKSSDSFGWIPKDPRSPAHPDYVRSNHPIVSERTNALNNVYKWVNGKWTYIRTGPTGLGDATLESDREGL